MRKVVALALVMMFAVSAFAASGKITLSQDTTVNGTKLAAGSYKVTYDENATDVKVTFKQGKTEVTAPATVQQTGTEPSNALVGVSTANGSRELKTLQLAGKKAALSFESSGASGAKSSAE